MFDITLQFRLGQKSTVKASWHYWWIWNVQEKEGQGRCRWESLHASPLSCLFQAARRSSRSEQAHLVQVITTAKCIWTLIPTLWSAGPQLATARTLLLHLLNQQELGAAIYKYMIYNIHCILYNIQYISSVVTSSQSAGGAGCRQPSPCNLTSRAPTHQCTNAPMHWCTHCYSLDTLDYHSRCRYLRPMPRWQAHRYDSCILAH